MAPLKIRPGVRTLGALLLLAAALWALAVSQHTLAGSYDDDGIYLQGAQSLAEGRSYRMLHLPSEPYQTKYPPLYPLLLSLLWRLGPAFPTNLPLLLAPGALCAAAAAWLYARLLQHMLGISKWVAFGLCAAWLLNNQVARFLSMAMTEMPFALCVAGALTLVEGERPRHAALAGLVAGLGALTRSIGITLPVGLTLWLCARRRWRDAGLLLATFVVVMLPWWSWQAKALHANGPLRSDVSYAYDIAYAAWFLSPLQELRVVFQNLVQSSLFWTMDLLPGCQPWLQDLVEAGGAALIVPWALAVLAVALVLGGIVTLWWRVRHAAAWLVPVYVAVVLLWPFEPARFYLPILPLLLGGALHLVATLWRSPRAPATVATVMAVVAVLHFVPWCWKATLQWDRGPMAGMARMLDVVRETTPAGSTLMITRGPMTSLYLGRKTLRLWPYDDPLIQYQESRPLARFFVGIPYEQRKTTADRERAREVFRSARRHGVTHAVAFPEMDLLGEWVFRYWASQLALPVVRRDPERKIEIMTLEGMVLEHFLAGN